MRRPLGVLLCLGSLAALSTPIATANAASAPLAECRVYAAKPYVTAAGRIQASAARLGCDDTALVRIRIKRAVAGADPVVKSASLRGTNGRVTVRLSCAPGVYYSVVTDYRGNVSRSTAVRLACSPTPTPTSTAKPTPAPVPTATPTTPGTTAPTPAPGGSSTSEEVVRLTNAERQKGGCAPLVSDPQLRSAAQGHSADMAAKNYFSHTSADGRNLTARIKASGFSPVRAWAENIAMGQRTPAEVVRAWMNSSGHRANIMNCGYTHLGVGVANSSRGIYWTQNFAKH
ncbi:CAP domain-containing protein [Streptosporangium sp. NBC_01755]|uniref:CAP domain-containing protein n=1 Tax=unclassified Streptosporangium TaxID=2632669 RepID=UPI002DDA958C|nr:MULTISPECIES: CAP domain-containing protein [unclassified Streptosporangium]WSA26529.1 CAP domain-containing protein [Streptosporangium sp. NBC_01810]WSD02048.1 CAP domain-containing protein [Streptosporangium sp. NBC_01755]